jgi:hypothetical protein
MLIPILTIYLLLKTNHNVILPSLPHCSDGRFFLLYQNYTRIALLVSLILDTPVLLTIPCVLYEQPSSSFFIVFIFPSFFVFILSTHVPENQAYTVQTFYNRIDSNKAYKCQLDKLGKL